MATISHFYEAFQPAHYDLFLDIDRGAKTITGRTTITGHASQATIDIHRKFLTINAVTVADQAVPFTLDDAREALTVTLPSAGDVTLTITYTAPLTDTMMGIYPSYYTVNGEQKQLIGTQFETTAARQAFPGVDEPEAKATFDLAIKFDEHPAKPSSPTCQKFVTTTACITLPQPSACPPTWWPLPLARCKRS